MLIPDFDMQLSAHYFSKLFQIFFSLQWEKIENTPRQKIIRALEIFRVQKLILNATS